MVRKFDKKTRGEIVRLYQSNSALKLSGIYKCDSFVIRRVLDEAGIKKRTHAESQKLRFKVNPESHGWRGKEHSVEQKAKWSKERFGKQRGKDNPCYKHGKHEGRWCRRFRAIRCQKCNSMKRIAIHHIDGNNKNNNGDNLMTLCCSCHIKLHWRQGDYNKKRNNQYTIKSEVK